MAKSRSPLSKRRRFDVFKRDQFICQYCGRRPPGVVLEVDHIRSVADGGSNEDHNLITSCFDCNRGKAAGTLDATQIDVSEKAAILRERIDQSRAYDDLLREQRDRLDFEIAVVIGVYEASFEGWTLFDSARQSIRNFLQKLPLSEVGEAMGLACAKVGRGQAFKYFCGICWNKIKAVSP